MGGTDIGAVLEAVFEGRTDDIPTSVFVLTDGKAGSFFCESTQITLTIYPIGMEYLANF